MCQSGLSYSVQWTMSMCVNERLVMWLMCMFSFLFAQEICRILYWLADGTQWKLLKTLLLCRWRWFFTICKQRVGRHCERLHPSLWSDCSRGRWRSICHVD